MISIKQSFKPDTNMIEGSASRLLHTMLLEKGIKSEMYDPFIDSLDVLQRISVAPAVFVIGTKHQEFKKFIFSNRKCCYRSS